MVAWGSLSLVQSGRSRSQVCKMVVAWDSLLLAESGHARNCVRCDGCLEIVLLGSSRVSERVWMHSRWVGYLDHVQPYQGCGVESQPRVSWLLDLREPLLHAPS